MKFQNDLIQNVNQTLKEEIGQFKEQQAMHPIRRKFSFNFLGSGLCGSKTE